MSLIKDMAPRPNPGDDLSCPDFIVTHRKQVMLGERMDLELLYVPDGANKDAPYTVQLALKSIDGRVLKSFELAVFDGKALRDVTYDVPAEEFAGQQVLIPSLTVKSAGGRVFKFEEGLHHIVVRPTWNWDRKWVHQPLRDLVIPRKSVFRWTEMPEQWKSVAAAEPGLKMLEASFACDEPLAQVEVLENDDVVYAVDPVDEFKRNDPKTALFFLELRSLRTRSVFGKAVLEGSEGACWLRDAFALHQKAPSPPAAGKVLKIGSNVNCWISGWFFTVPREEMEKAVLSVDTDAGRLAVPLSKVVNSGSYSEAYKGGFNITISRYYKQPDIPVHVNGKQVSFTAPVKPELSNSVFHLRAVTKSGKIYRSRPILLPQTSGGGMTDINVFSERLDKGMALKVPAGQVPCITYDFTPEYGTTLHTGAGRPFWGNLGGYVDSSVGRGGGEGGTNGTPFALGRNYPADAMQTAPQWVQEGDRWLLRFDGNGSHIVLPLETLPYRSGFRLRFEIRPSVLKPAVLFIHHGYYIGSLSVKMKADGTVYGSYCDRFLKVHNFDTGSKVNAGKWSAVEIIYDQNSLQAGVDGSISPVFACPGRGLYQGTAVFGGFGGDDKEANFVGSTGWFEGDLRALSIDHRR